MKKLQDYKILFYVQDEDGNSDDIFIQSSDRYIQAAQQCEAAIDEIPLTERQRQELYFSIMRVIDSVAIDTFAQFGV